MIEDDALLASPLDVTDEQQAREAVEAGLKRFGRIDVVVNNAGCSTPSSSRRFRSVQPQTVLANRMTAATSASTC